jgi:hypothetical protein
VEEGLAMPMLEAAALEPEPEPEPELAETPAGAVGITRRMEEVIELAAITGLEAEDWPAETPGAPGEPDMLGATGPVMAGPEGPVMEAVPAGMVPAGMVPAGAVGIAPAGAVGIAPAGAVPVGIVAPGMTVDSTMAEVSVSHGVVVASAGGELEATVGVTIASFSAGVLEPASWQSASPRTARHRLMGMLMRPPEVEELCWQWASPRTARQTLMGTLIRAPLSPEEEDEAWSHLAWPRAAIQVLTGTLIKPLVVLLCLHSTSPRTAVQRPTGTLIRLSLAWTLEAEAARATREVIIDCFILSRLM